MYPPSLVAVADGLGGLRVSGGNTGAVAVRSELPLLAESEAANLKRPVRS